MVSCPAYEACRPPLSPLEHLQRICGEAVGRTLTSRSRKEVVAALSAALGCNLVSEFDELSGFLRIGLPCEEPGCTRIAGHTGT